MKRFILIALALAGCVQFDPAQTFTREALDMPTTYTPNPANNPATITLPTAGDPVASSVADQAWKDIADKDARKVQGAVSGQTGTINGFVQVNGGGGIDIQNGGSFTTQAGSVEAHNGTESHNGAEFHVGAETHTGAEGHSGGVTLTGGLDVTGGTHLHDNVLANGAITLSTGGWLQLHYVPVADIDETHPVTDGQLYVAATFTGAHVIRFTNTGAAAGAFVILELLSGTAGNSEQVKRDDGTVITTLVNSGTPGDKYGVVLFHNGTNWFVGFHMILP